MAPTSPYTGRQQGEWLAITQKLVAEFPLAANVILPIVQGAYNDLYASKIGSAGLLIGKDIFLPAQATGVILEKLIAYRLKDIAGWRAGNAKTEKDIVNTKDEKFSFEIKTSSDPKGVYGNKSMTQVSADRAKFQAGYYLVVNYKNPKEDDPTRQIYSVRLGWLDDGDWVGQASQTGQQAYVPAGTCGAKLVILM